MGHVKQKASVCWTRFQTPWGLGFIAATQAGICRVALAGRPKEEFLGEIRQQNQTKPVQETSVLLKTALEQFGRYWQKGQRRFDLALDLQGTVFQRQVWQVLMSIRPGETVSYKEVAQAADRPNAFQAVGRAVGTNPVPIIVPCHRVIGTDGSLTGYAGGLAAKQWLLRHEGALLL